MFFEGADSWRGHCGGKVILRIISNLAVLRLARVSAVFTPEEMSDGGKDAKQGSEVIDGVIQAYHFAEADPFRVMVPAHSHFARSINCCKGAPCPGRNGESTFGPNQDAIGN